MYCSRSGKLEYRRLWRQQTICHRLQTNRRLRWLKYLNDSWWVAYCSWSLDRELILLLVTFCAKYSVNPGIAHGYALLRILRYSRVRKTIYTGWSTGDNRIGQLALPPKSLICLLAFLKAPEASSRSFFMRGTGQWATIHPRKPLPPSNEKPSSHALFAPHPTAATTTRIWSRLSPMPPTLLYPAEYSWTCNSTSTLLPPN